MAEETDYKPETRSDWSVPVCKHYTETALQYKHKRVLFIGDSITDQWRVPAKHQYPGGLEVWKKTSRSRIISVSAEMG